MPKGLARAFARSVGIKDHHNFPRAMDPNDEVHTFVEDWQPLYNVRWLEKVETSGTATSSSGAAAVSACTRYIRGTRRCPPHLRYGMEFSMIDPEHAGITAS